MHSAVTGHIEKEFKRRVGIDFGALCDRLRNAPDVTIVIPVYNGGETVRECALSVIDHTHGHRVVLLDDGSTDVTTLKVLEELGEEYDVEVIRNESNIGYTRTANRAISIAAQGDLILLNSDTIVGSNWVERLRWTAYSARNVASVSACSDNAGAMAMPTPGVANEWPAHLSWTQTARLVAQQADSISIESPTAHGFCMYLRRDALDALGDFDDVSFPFGYGEENDWSMRALGAGFVNLVAPHVFVKHLQGASFGDRRATLIAQARGVVDSLHPSYRRLVGEWMRSDAMRAVRSNSAKIRELAKTVAPLPRTLYVLHASGGGTPETNRDLMDGLVHSQEAFLLVVSDRLVRLLRWTRGQGQAVMEWRPNEPFTLHDSWRDDYAAIVAQIVITKSIDLIHVRHLIDQPLTTVPHVAKILGVPMILSTHDFYYICPTVHLLDEKGRFCGGVCTPGDGPCILPTRFVRAAPNLKHNWVEEWRRRAGTVLDASRHVIATTRSAAEIYATNYPRHADKLRIIEHGRDLSLSWTKLRLGRARRPGPLRIACAANWAFHKGTEYLQSVVELTGGSIEWHMLGAGSDYLGDGVVNHGQYSREQSRDVFDQIDPDFFGLFSIWAETYSHTLTEAWALGVPVVATDIGAVADRIRDHGGGSLFALDSPESVATYLLAQAESLERGTMAIADVPRHSIRSRTTMAEDYALLYDQTRRSLRRPVIGYIARGGGGIHPGSTHVRLRRRMLHPTAGGFYFKSVDVFDFVRGADSTEYSSIVVQRDAIPPDVVDEFIRRCESKLMPYVVDMDDDLISPAARARLIDQGYDPRALDGLRALIASAAEVCVSTEELATRVVSTNDRVTVVLNEVDEGLWMADTSAVEVGSEDVNDSAELRVLYMGSNTHAGDLELLRDVFGSFHTDEGRRIVLEVVGVTTSDQPWFERLQIPQGLDQYPRLVRWLRSMGPRWDLAVAPLEDTLFNRAKSDLKFLEYTMLGLPTVASRVGPYSALESTGAILVDNEPGAWRTAILDALKDPQVAKGRLEGSKSYVLNERTLGKGSGMMSWLAHVGQKATARRGSSRV